MTCSNVKFGAILHILTDLYNEQCFWYSLHNMSGNRSIRFRKFDDYHNLRFNQKKKQTNKQTNKNKNKQTNITLVVILQEM